MMQLSRKSFTSFGSLYHVIGNRAIWVGQNHCPPATCTPPSAFWKGSQSLSTSSNVDSKADSVLTFWLGEGYLGAPKNDTITSKRAMWFQGSAETDQACKQRFSALLQDAASDRLHWTEGYEGLAAVILMDQLSRNVYRGSAKMYDLDSKSLHLAKSIHEGGSTKGFPAMHRVWLYMTHMHSESLQDQELGILRFKELLEEAKGWPDSEALQESLQDNISYGEAHCKVIEKWGRFPHRNKILGRQNTPEEAKAFEEGSIPNF